MMGRELKRLKRRKETIQRMDRLLEHDDITLVIHYSCESFYDRADGRTPRITSIAVRNLRSGQTESFSIHQIAEEQGIDLGDITDHYNEIETQMLDRYFEFVEANQNCSWVHWNMRDVNYGFAAIEHRYRVLGGQPIPIAEKRKFDLSSALVDIYGVAYIGHPRLLSIIGKNRISDRDLLSGAEEAVAFENKDFVRLHQSTLRKVYALADLFERCSSSDLKTNSSWIKQHGLTPSVLAELVKEHWVVTGIVILSSILALVLFTFELLEKFTTMAP